MGNSLKKNLEILRAAGLAVPEHTIRFAEDQELRRRGIKSIWRCNCGFRYESEIPLLQFDHGCGMVSKEEWSPTTGFAK